jgi:hypothetical protein
MKICIDPIYGKFAAKLRKGTTYNVEVVEEKTLHRLVRVANYRNAEFPRTMCGEFLSFINYQQFAKKVMNNMCGDL